jgi:hypothetical protein
VLDQISARAAIDFAGLLLFRIDRDNHERADDKFVVAIFALHPQRGTLW